MKYTHILWDWNGTLLDDVNCAVDCVNAMLAEYGLPPTNINEYYEMMEPSLEKYYAKLVDPRQHSYEELVSLFQREYAKRADSLKLMSGAKDVVKALSAKCEAQYIVSSFEKSRLIQYAKRFDMYKYFKAVSGADDILVGEKSKRAAALIRGVSPSKAVFIGDTVNDYITAEDLKCDCILIANGHQSERDLRKTGAKVLRDIREILTQKEFN